MSKHTPGPWRTKRTGDEVWIVAPAPKNLPVFRTIHDQPGRKITQQNVALVYDWDEAGSLPRDANARLIAAAPEMLAALQQLVDALPTDGRQAPGAAVLASLNARAVIAKAAASDEDEEDEEDEGRLNIDERVRADEEEAEDLAETLRAKRLRERMMADDGGEEE